MGRCVRAISPAHSLRTTDGNGDLMHDKLFAGDVVLFANGLFFLILEDVTINEPTLFYCFGSPSSAFNNTVHEEIFFFKDLENITLISRLDDVV